MGECLYINPWRRTKDGTPVYQKSKPKLKSAFADRCKHVVHQRSSFRREEIVRRVGDVVITRRWSAFMPYTISYASSPVGIGASSIAHAMCVAANVRNYEVCNYTKEVQGATWAGGEL